MSPVLNVAGRQDRNSETLSNKTPKQSSNPPQKKKRRRKKPKRETAGSQESTKRPGNSSRLRDLAKRGGEHFVIGKADKRERQWAGERETEVAA